VLHLEKIDSLVLLYLVETKEMPEEIIPFRQSQPSCFTVWVRRKDYA
jgi:hypothetical protein